MRILTTIIVLLLALPAYAAPVKIPTLKICASGDSVTVKQKCSKFETQVNLSSLKGKDGLNGANGTSGAPGIEGAPGLINIKDCRRREQVVSGNGFVTASASCLTNEFMLNSGCWAYPGAIVGNQLTGAFNSLLGPDIYHFLYCTGWDFGGGLPFTVTAQVLCCKG